MSRVIQEGVTVEIPHRVPETTQNLARTRFGEPTSCRQFKVSVGRTRNRSSHLILAQPSCVGCWLSFWRSLAHRDPFNRTDLAKVTRIQPPIDQPCP
jgi:hypothetical protein